LLIDIIYSSTPLERHVDEQGVLDRTNPYDVIYFIFRFLLNVLLIDIIYSSTTLDRHMDEQGVLDRTNPYASAEAAFLAKALPVVAAPTLDPAAALADAVLGADGTIVTVDGDVPSTGTE
jgi:hypothetical protein